MKWIFFTKLQLPPEPLTKGLPPPYPHSLCPLSSTEFVEPPDPEQNSWVRHCSYGSMECMYAHACVCVCVCVFLTDFVCVNMYDTMVSTSSSMVHPDRLLPSLTTSTHRTLRKCICNFFPSRKNTIISINFING